MRRSIAVPGLTEEATVNPLSCFWRFAVSGGILVCAGVQMLGTTINFKRTSSKSFLSVRGDEDKTCCRSFAPNVEVSNH